ncbi:ATP-dependent DNA helicase RecG, partial [Salmonella enterica subsp. enterica serovar Infantis]
LLIRTASRMRRTMALTAYADLFSCVIDVLPPGRTTVTSVAIPDNRRHEIIFRGRYACTTVGGLAYWVCKLIDDSVLLESHAAEA